MPEGPEIQLAADEVAAAIAGRPTTAVSFAFDVLKQYETRLSGVVVTAVQARGKAMVTRFANGWNIYSHNQLYGKWVVCDAYDFPDTNRQLRLAIHNEAKSALLYSASDIAVLQDHELESHPFLAKLGPDLLDSAVTISQVSERLEAAADLVAAGSGLFGGSGQLFAQRGAVCGACPPEFAANGLYG